MLKRALGVTATVAFAGFACNGKVAIGGPEASETTPDGGGTQATGPTTGPTTDPLTGADLAPPTGTLARADKVDLLLAIDNSASMGDKQELLRQAVPDLVGRLLNPLCIDPNTHAVLGTSSGGVCASGTLEYAPVRDLHIGIVSSSLGGRGADICNGQGGAGGGTRHDDDKGHLLNRASNATGDPSEFQLADAPNGVLAYGPDGITDPTRFLNDLTQLVAGVHEYGCGIEAQMESWYRFLIQPDPYASIDVDQASSRASLNGVDGTILAQRRAFLRPDSLVAIVVLSDEDDSAADPLSVGGQGWVYARSKFLGSCGGGAARGTSACDAVATVESIACTSCGFPGHEDDPNCQELGDTCGSTGQPQRGYYPFAEDTLNTRFVRMKQRYGMDPQFPIARYVVGLSSAKIPDRNGEHRPHDVDAGFGAPEYADVQNCDNPLFATNLPTDPNADLCHLTPGPRAPNLVVYATITGVPHQLLSPTLDDAAWTRIMGKNPAHYDYSGIDPHMIQSEDPRPGIAAGVSAADTTDPWHGREWDTGKADLQYACTFPLTTPKDCNDPRFHDACDCEKVNGPFPPLCDPKTPTTQIRGKAYPGIRELAVARALGSRSVVASICPATLDPASTDYGFRPAVRALGDRMAASLAPPQ